jgi:uncharacterized SAM-binding protein YcdF (DUF218 family)
MSAAARPRTRKTTGGSRGGRSGGDGSGARGGRKGWWARLPRSLRRSLIALGVLLVLYLVRVPLLVGMAKLLVIDDEPGRADMIVMLGGNLDFRPPKVAELYREGVAKRVILARVQDLPAEQMLVYPNETDAAVKMLGMLGVPDSAITVLRTPGGVTSTVDEAKALRAYLEPRGPATVVLVTSLPHTRRARWAFRRELKGLPVILRISAAKDTRYDESNWWRSETGLIQFFDEYVKFAHNLIYR